MGGVPEIGPVDFGPLPPATNVDLSVGLGSGILSVSAAGNFGPGSMYFPSPYGLGGNKFDWMFFVSGQQFRLKVTAKIHSYERDTGRKHNDIFKSSIYSEMYVEATTTLAFDRVTGKAVGIVESPSLVGVYREFIFDVGFTSKTELSRTSLPSTATSTRWGNPRFGKTMAEVSGSSFRLFKGNWMSFIKVSGP